MYMFKHFTRAIERLIRVKSRCFEKIDTFLLNGHIGPALQSAPPPPDHWVISFTFWINGFI